MKVKVKHVRTHSPRFIVCSSASLLLTLCLGSQATTLSHLHKNSLASLELVKNSTAFVMAILPSHPGIKVSIVCNGAALQEYDDEDDETQTHVVSKYIEAVSGAEFGIKCEVSPPWPPNTLLFIYYLDQKWVGGRYAMQISYNPPNWTCIEQGSRTIVDGQSYLHKFAFAALTIGKRFDKLGPRMVLTIHTADDAATNVGAHIMKEIKGMGEITVTAYLVKNVQKSYKANYALTSNIADIGKIPEKALKGRSLSHQTL